MATTYLTLLIALLISAFSLPQDFKSKTIYTVVTKPVRAGDIVLGRILGFTLIGTALLAVMAMFSALFVWRMLNHTHAIDVANLQNDYDAKRNPIGKSGRTSLSQSHRHEVIINSDGSGRALSTNEHEHAISARQVGSETVYEVSNPEGMFRARVPEYGNLRFLDRKGVPVAKGVNVGNEWQYRSFVDGGTQAAAIWTFSGVNASHLRTEEDEDGQVRQVLPLELIVRVFRTYKGNVETGIQGSMQLRNPETQLKSDLWTFTAKDASINTFNWPLKLDDENRNAVDLIDDMVSKDGRLEVIVQCIDNAQYFGFAMPDCFIRLPDGSPLWNYIKAQVSIWVQMVLVIAIGVTCSTVVNGPVAMISTGGLVILGFFWQFFFDVATGKQIGGGPLESTYRMVTQMNQMSPLPENFGTQMIVVVDTVLRPFMFGLAYLLPDFRSFSTVDYIAYGFYIPINRLAQELTACLAFLAGLFVAGYFLLRTREVAK
jgi:ABC-type transport system involved in multi-copper enzyme maturation permease subunit